MIHKGIWVFIIRHNQLTKSFILQKNVLINKVNCCKTLRGFYNDKLFTRTSQLVASSPAFNYTLLKGLVTQASSNNARYLPKSRSMIWCLTPPNTNNTVWHSPFSIISEFRIEFDTDTSFVLKDPKKFCWKIFHFHIF